MIRYVSTRGGADTVTVALGGEYTSFKEGSGYDETTGLFYGVGSLTFSPARDYTGNETIRTWTMPAARPLHPPIAARA